MTDIAKLAIALDTKSLESGLVQLDNLGKKSGASEMAMQKLKKESSALAIGQAKLAQINAKLDAETDELARSTLIASRANQEYINSTAAASIKAQALAIQTGKAEKATNGMGGATRNLSFQLNQVAQQGAVTGNYLGALAIQLPDMLLSFGTLGILVGAAAGVMAGPLLTALSGADEGSEELSDQIKELTNDLENATYAQLQFVRAQNSEKIKDQNEKIQDAKKKLAEYSKEMDKLLATTGGFGLRATELNKLMDEQQAVIDTARMEVQKYKGETENAGSTKFVENIKSINDGLVDQLAKLTLNSSELLRRELLLNNANDAEVASALHMQASIDKIKAETDALNKQAAARDALASQIGSVEQQLDPMTGAVNAAQRRLDIINEANEQDQANQAKYDALRVANAEKLSQQLIAIEQSTQSQKNTLITAEGQKTLGMTAQFFGNMAEIARAGGEDQFNNYKNLASAQALISASLAIIGVLGDPTIPTLAKPFFAGAMGGLAAVQIAQIQSQEYQGARAMGGQVSSGNSYLVGENGPEIVHMNGNGSVQANHNIGGSSPQITNVFQISPGIQGTVQAEIMSAVPLMKKAAISAYNEARRKGQLR